MWRFGLIALIALAGCGDNELADCSTWRQWGNDAAHRGQSCAQGQPLEHAQAAIVFDPFTSQEQGDTWGHDLVVHYQAPLVDGDAIYMMQKTGTYTPCEVKDGLPDCYEPDELHRLDSQVWTETRYARDAAGRLYAKWSFDSDWKPEPFESFEPMFQPVLVGDRLWVPGAGGALWELDAGSGKVVRHVTPFGATLDPETFVAGALTYANGVIYYNVVDYTHGHGWLVAVDDGGHARAADYQSLVAGAPAPDDLCYGTFRYPDTPLPWPPPPNPDGTPVLPPQQPCGPQFPGLNAAIAVGDDGTLYTVSHAAGAWRYSYMIAVTPKLEPKWATSMRGLLDDGCGVTVPSDGTDTDHQGDCRVGAQLGVDPATNMPPAATVDNASSASPVALPGGGVLYGALTGYNQSRGHLLKFAADGSFAGSYDFGWDTTPAIVPDGSGGSSYAIVIKDNHYGEDANGVDLGPYSITELDADLHVKWQFTSTNTQSCARLPDGTTTCADDHPHGFEWCINAPAVDADGVIYANSEDGNIYAITADGQERDHYFLFQALGAAYTPLALDDQGRVYALNDGAMMILGR